MANTKITSNVISDDIALGGNPTTTTQSAGNDTTRIATTAFVKAAIDATIDSAPGALDTLNELAAAIGDDANFSTTITNSIATKLPLAGGTMTGDLLVKPSASGATATSNTVGTFESNDNTEVSILGGSSSVLALNFGHSGDNDEGLLSFNTTSGSEDMLLQSTKDITLRTTSTNSTAGDINFKSYNTTIMHIDGGNNRVGIGIDEPTQKLDVRGGTGGGTLTHAIFTGTSGRGLQIRSRSDTSGGQHSGTAEINAADSEGTGGDLAFSSNGNVKMFIDGSGKISIGNNVPMWSGSYGGGLFLKGNNSTSDRYARLAIVDSNGAETASGSLTLNNNGSVEITREVNGSASVSYEEILKISRSGGATSNNQREAAISFHDNANSTYTAMITGYRESPAGNYNGGLSIYTNSHADNGDASSISEMVSGKAVTFNSSQSSEFFGSVYITGANNSFQQNGVGRVAKGGSTAGNASVSYTINHSNQSTFHVRCAFNHYGFLSYGCALDQVIANGSGGLSSLTAIINHTTSVGGSWSIARVDATSFTVTKNAGTYAGGGYYHIIVEGANLT